jgi:hypothetical protein
MEQLYKKTKKNGKTKYAKVNLKDLADNLLVDRMTLSPGLWLVKEVPNCKSLSSVSKVSRIPDYPYDFTSIIMNRDELADFLVKFNNDYTKKHPSSRNGWQIFPSYSELAEAILNELIRLAGLGFGEKREVPVTRKLDLEL